MSSFVEDDLKTPTAQYKKQELHSQEEQGSSSRNVFVHQKGGKEPIMIVPSVEQVDMHKEEKSACTANLEEKSVIKNTKDSIQHSHGVNMNIYKQFERESESSICQVFDTSGIERYRTGCVSSSILKEELLSNSKSNSNNLLQNSLFPSLSTPISVSAGSALAYSKRSDGSAIVAEIAARQLLYEPITSTPHYPSILYTHSVDPTDTWWDAESVTARVKMAQQCQPPVFTDQIVLHLKCVGLEMPKGITGALKPFACFQREREQVGSQTHGVWDTFLSTSTVCNEQLGQRQRLALARQLSDTQDMPLEAITPSILQASADFPVCSLPMQTLLSGTDTSYIRVLILHQDSMKSRPVGAAIISIRTLRALVLQAMANNTSYYVQPLHIPHRTNYDEEQKDNSTLMPRIFLSLSAPMFNVTNTIAMTPQYRPIPGYLKHAYIQLKIQTLGPIIGLENSKEKKFASSAYLTFKTYVKDSICIPEDMKNIQPARYQRVLTYFTPVQTSIGVLSWNITLPVLQLTGGLGDYDQQVRISVMDALLHTQGYKETAFCIVTVRELILMGTHPWMLYNQSYDLEDRAIHQQVKSVYRQHSKKTVNQSNEQSVELKNMETSKNTSKNTSTNTSKNNMNPSVMQKDNGSTDIDTTSLSILTHPRPGFLGTTRSTASIEELTQHKCISEDDGNQDLQVVGCLLISSCGVLCPAPVLEQAAAAHVYRCNKQQEKVTLKQEEVRINTCNEKFKVCLLDSYSAYLVKSNVFTGKMRASEQYQQQMYMKMKQPSLLYAFLAYTCIPSQQYTLQDLPRLQKNQLHEKQEQPADSFEALNQTAEQYIVDNQYDKNYLWSMRGCNVPKEGQYRVEVYVVRMNQFYLYKTSSAVKSVKQGKEYLVSFDNQLLPMRGCVENPSSQGMIDTIPTASTDSRVEYYIKKRDSLRKERYNVLQSHGVDQTGVHVSSALSKDEMMTLQHSIYWNEEFIPIHHDVLDLPLASEEEPEMTMEAFHKLTSQQQVIVVCGEHEYIDYNRILIRLVECTEIQESIYGIGYTGLHTKQTSSIPLVENTVLTVGFPKNQLEFDTESWELHHCGRPAELIGISQVQMHGRKTEQLIGEVVVLLEDVKNQVQEQRKQKQTVHIRQQKALLSELAIATTHDVQIDQKQKQQLLFGSELDTTLVTVDNSVSTIALPLLDADQQMSQVSIEIQHITQTNLKDKKFRKKE